MLKRIKQVLLCIAILSIITACGHNDYYDNNENDINGIYDLYENEYIFTIACALYDLDFVVNILENNFALFDVAYRQRGVDIRQLSENARRAILESETMNYSTFAGIMIGYFFPLVNLGHFRISIPPEMARSGDIYIENPATFALRALPYSARGYIEALAKYKNLNLDNLMVLEFLMLASTPYEDFSEMLEVFYLTIGAELTEKLQQALQERNFESFVYFHEGLAIQPHHPLSTTVRILEEDKIGYIRIPSFMASPHTGALSFNDEEKIFDFFYEIRNFEHLIIDLRGNGGGLVEPFFQIFIAPNISTSSITDGFVFMIEDSYDLRLARNITSAIPASAPMADTNAVMTVEEMLESGFYLPNLNLDDLYRFHYVLPFQTTVQPRRIGIFDNQPAFEGKIWILTDRNMGSAAEIVARFVQQTGFATLVGDITGGNFGGLRTTNHPLPNSPLRLTFDLFYVVDGQGRTFEEGTIPNHFRKPGKTTLETTLALIADMP